MTESPTTTDETPATRSSRLDTTDLALIAAFAALIAVCSYLAAIPMGGAGVPLTLQGFALLLTGALLGPLRGTAAVVLYLLLGVAGLPVFAGHAAGPGVFVGVTGGYLWSFPLMVLAVGLLVKYVLRTRRTNPLLVFAACVVGVVINHVGGIIGMAIVLHVSLPEAAVFDAPYWIGDFIKAAVAAVVASQVHRAFPKLLARRA
ncbi:biotin transporter BioY [Nocardioides sp. NPDC059952]|uniref:biotin transporter BioY n=1 Tax=Nocardioides sp. NPDC059952 TaxID=3347014 RepID=UPI003667A19C